MWKWAQVLSAPFQLLKSVIVLMIYNEITQTHGQNFKLFMKAWIIFKQGTIHFICLIFVTFFLNIYKFI